MSHALRLVPRHFLTTALLFGLSCAAAIAATPAAQPAKSPAPSQAQLAQTYGKLPLRFESNNGQTDPSVKFLSRGSAYSLYLTNSAAVLSLAKGKAGNTDSIRMELAGANPQAKAAGADQLPGVTNYFIGNDPAKWHSNIPTYTKVQYSDIYPGVDLVYYGNQRQLEYDFVIAPGASPDTILLNFSGQKRLRLSGNGDLILQGAKGLATLHKPLVYQEKNGRRQIVPAAFRRSGRNSVSFRLGNYDHARTLVIDPVLAYATYLGGSGYSYQHGFETSLGDSGAGIAVDKNGGAYVVGTTYSLDFPVTAGAYQSANKDGATVFITKFNAAGTALVYSTFLGGSGGSSYGAATGVAGDFGAAIAVDSSGSAYITGTTYSTDFPVTANAVLSANPAASQASTGFVAKLNSAGTALDYSTYLGGSTACQSVAIAVDSSGSAYVAGTTGAEDFPTTAGVFQPKRGAQGVSSVTNAFVSKLNPTGTALAYSTYVGGSLLDSGAGIAVDSAGDAFVTGSAYSKDFPVTSGAFQSALPVYYGQSAGFVTKLNPSASALVYSTYLGGHTYGSFDTGIAVDSAGSAYVVGVSSSPDFDYPTTSGAFLSSFAETSTGAVFISKLTPAGSALAYSTFLPVVYEYAYPAVAVDSAGDAYVGGSTIAFGYPESSSPVVPIVGPPPFSADSFNAFLLKLNSTGTAADYSTIIGGTNNISGYVQGSGLDYGFAVAVDADGGAYLTGTTSSSDFPVTPGAYQATIKGGPNSSPNAFVTKVALASESKGLWLPAIAISPSAPTAQQGQSITLTAQVNGPAGDPIPTGAITFYVITYSDQVGYISYSQQVPLQSNGMATWTVSSLPQGSYSAYAGYSGDSNYLAFVPTTWANFTFFGPPVFVSASTGTEAGSYGRSSASISATVEDSLHHPLQGIPVSFSGTGLQFSPATPVTNASGVATTTPTALIAGNLTATASVAGTTYTATFNIIVPKDPLYISARNVAVTYGQTPPPITSYFLTGFIDGDTASVVSGAPVLTTTVTKTTPVGIYKIGVQVGTLTAVNYYFNNFSSGEGAVEVNKAPLSIAARSITTTYGQAPQQPTAYTIAGFVNGDTQATATTGVPTLSTNVTATTPAGNYPITVGVGTLSAANYYFKTTASGEGVAEVAKAPLTILPASFTIHVGDPLPAFTYSISGFVNGNTQATAITGTPTLTTTAPNTSTPGHYYIIANTGSLAATNYYFNRSTFATDGILTILPN